MSKQEMKKQVKSDGQELDLTSYQPLPVVYQLRYSILKRVKAGEEVIPEIQGREEARKDVARALLSGAHPYLVSEEGTGKTRLAKSLTRLLPSVPVIKGCPYHDDPKWPRSLLCPRCRASADPVKEYGIELMPGEKRFSRIQGNEYTNEAKLLGLKDIQAIAQGMSPADPQVFTGTGVFRANRGILFIDELPAIRTKVQVLLHPILEEKKAVLEEYNWEHPLDLILVATGNPQGFSHVNEVPRPLLDRLELIYMDLPEEHVEHSIMLQERFRIKKPFEEEESRAALYPSLEGIEREVVAPWWTMQLVNRSVRFSRVCRWLDKRASIRGTTKAIDHTYASAELENHRVARLKDASDGLKLALRGRIGLRPDLIDIENPRETLKKTDEVVDDMLFNTIEEMGNSLLGNYDKDRLVKEVNELFSENGARLTDRLARKEELNRLVTYLKKAAPEKVHEALLNRAERELFHHPEQAEPQVQEEYNLSAVETIVNILWHKGNVNETVRKSLFIPQRVSWAQKAR